MTGGYSRFGYFTFGRIRIQELPDILAEITHDSAKYHFILTERGTYVTTYRRIGVGYLGQHHARIFAEIEHVDWPVCPIRTRHGLMRSRQSTAVHRLATGKSLLDSVTLSASLPRRQAP